MFVGGRPRDLGVPLLVARLLRLLGLPLGRHFRLRLSLLCGQWGLLCGDSRCMVPFGGGSALLVHLVLLPVNEDGGLAAFLESGEGATAFIVPRLALGVAAFLPMVFLRVGGFHSMQPTA